MSALEMRTVDVKGWPVAFLSSDDEPRIRDFDLAERLGYERPRSIRDLIERMQSAGKLNDIHQCRTARRWPGQVAPQTVSEYYLTEAQALKVAAKSETDPADALLDEMIKVYMLARRGQIVAPRPDRLHLSLLSQSRSALLRGDGQTARVLVRALDELLSGQRAAVVAPVPAETLTLPAAPIDLRGRSRRPGGTHHKTIVAAMSPEEFRAARDMMGGNAVIEKVVKRSPGAVAGYLNGRVSISADVAERVRAHLLTLSGPAPAPTGGRPKTVAAMSAEDHLAAASL